MAQPARYEPARGDPIGFRILKYLKRKRNMKKHKKTKTQNATKKKLKTKTRKNTIEDSVEEESDN